MVSTPVTQKKPNRAWSINFETLPFKIHFFLYLGAVAGVLPFITVYSKSKLHLTDGQVASLYATYQLITVFTKPMIGWIVDYFNRLKLVIIILSIGYASTVLTLLFIPGIENISSDSEKIDRKFTSSFILDCNFSTSSPSCQLVQHFCYNSLHMKPNKTFVQSDFYMKPNVLKSSNDKYPHVCDTQNGYIPHSLALNALKCNKKEVDEDSQTNLCTKFERVESNRNNLKASIIYKSKLDFGQLKTKIAFDDAMALCFLANLSDILLEHKSVNVNLYISNNLNEFYYDCELQNANYEDCNIIEELARVLKKSTESDSSNEEEFIRGNVSISPYRTYNFWLFVIILLCSGTCSNALFTLSDTACHEILQKTGCDYGKQRLWGALGWGSIAALSGFLNDLASENTTLPEYSPGFFISVGLIALMILNISRLDLVKPEMPKSVWKDVKILMKNKEFIIFEMGVFLTGFFVSAIWFYLTVFLLSIGSGKFLMGLLQTCQSMLGVIPLMFFSGKILNKIGYMNAMALSFTCFAIRFSCYHILQDPWFVLPVEITHGVCYGLFYSSLTSFAKSSAPEGTEATTQSLLCTVYEGVGAGLGCVAVGICFDYFGGRETFFYLSISAMVAAILQLLTSLWMKSQKRSIKIQSVSSISQ